MKTITSQHSLDQFTDFRKPIDKQKYSEGIQRLTVEEMAMKFKPNFGEFKETNVQAALRSNKRVMDRAWKLDSLNRTTQSGKPMYIRDKNNKVVKTSTIR